MSSVTAKALLQFEQSRCLERQEYEVLESDLSSLALGDHKDAMTNPALHIPDRDQFKLIQRLDSHLYHLVREKDYDKALGIALEMQKHAPESYYGYQRAAQIHLIRNRYRKAFRVITLGYKKVTHGIGLLHKSVEDILHIFDQAATELAEDRMFERADGIAGWMISLLPTSPVGYLRAAQLYEMRGMTKAAMEVYEKGISYVPFDDRDLFTERISCLKQRIHWTPRYDFITQMPLEITSKISQYLTVHDLIECLKVSKGWKERIEQCPEAWHILKVENHGGNINVAAIRYVMAFVRQITFRSATTNPSLVKDLLTSISNREFENITSLGLDRDTTHAQYIPHLIRIFEHVKLTCLDLIFCFSKADSYIPLDQVLGSCTHLERLTYHTCCFPMRVDHERLPKKPTMITHLSIGGYTDEVNEGKIETPHFFIPLIPLFPHLVDLCMSDSHPGDLQTITKQCSNLRRLVVMKQPYEVFRDFPDSKHTAKGLQYLKIDGFIDPVDVAYVIAQNSSTLISVDVTLDYETEWNGQLIDPDWDYTHIPKLDCPLLKKLHFLIYYYWPYEQWIGDCPVLEEVNLEAVIDLTDSVFNTLKRLPNLRLLDFEDCQKLTDGGLSTFFKDLQKQGSQLHTVAIRFCDLLSADTLLSLVALKSLRSLVIQSCKGVTEAVFQDFAAKVDSINNIETMTLHNLDGVTDQTLLHVIHALPRLQRLHLSYLNKITDNSLSEIAVGSSRTSLSKLTVHSCSRITSGAIKKAKKLLDVSDAAIE